ncbi:MAG: GDP-L-fucose synthase [Lentimicrobium sp.]|nr:GDP-L-fucose synthase [Lentimicrobium sp.]
MNKENKIYVAGHQGLVGSAIVRNLINKGYNNIITRSHSELDLTVQSEVAGFFKAEKPEYVVLAAAKVGGIMANNVFRAQFIYENLQIQNNVIHSAYVNKVKKLLFLGSSCVYPKLSTQPMREEYLLSSELEYTNEPYAIAKIAGLKMCEAYNLQYGTDFLSVMPTNLFGLNDNYNLESSHVLPALIRKIHLSKCLQNNDFEAIQKDLLRFSVPKSRFGSVEAEISTYLDKLGIQRVVTDGIISVNLSLWGSGSPLREFLWSDDMADACVFLLENYSFRDLLKIDGKADQPEIRNMHINIGSGREITIRDLASIIKKIIGFEGTITFDTSKPDGTPRKLLDVSRLSALGWQSTVTLEEGIKMVYADYISQ